MPLRRRKVRRVALVPTLLTLGNTLCGFFAIVKIGEGGAAHYVMAAQLVLLAMAFDVLDGAIARLARVAGNFGAQLDSLSDVLSFGVAPAYLVMRVGLEGMPFLSGQLLLILAGFYVVCTAVRLARFNVENAPEEAAHQSFAGLPSPAAAGVLVTSILVWGEYRERFDPSYALTFQRLIPFLLLVLGVLMITRVRYEHMLNRFLRRTHPFVRLVEVLLAVVCVALLPEPPGLALWIGFLYYVLRGPFLFVKNRVLHPEAEPVALPAEEDLF